MNNQNTNRKNSSAYWNRRIAALSCAIMLMAAGCAPAQPIAEDSAQTAAGTETAQTETTQTETSQTETAKERPMGGMGGMQGGGSSQVTTEQVVAVSDITDRDRAGTWEEDGAIHVTLLGDTAQIDSVGATMADGLLTITRAGSYVLTGQLNGSIVVSATNSDKIQLVLNGVSVTSPDGPALHIVQADKVFLTLAPGTVNTLSDSQTYTQLDSDNEPDGCIFSKDDLTINGTGALTVTGSYGHGIVCKDTLAVVDASLTVVANNDGLKGTDAVYITGNATVNLTTQSDGVHTKGDFVLDSGEVVIAAGDDGVHSDGNLTISGGKMDVTKSYEGLEALMLCITGGQVDVIAEDDGLNSAGGSDTEDQSQTTDPRGRNNDEFSAVAGALIAISGGTVNVQAGGDGLDSNGDLMISAGTVTVSGPTNSANGAIDYNGGAAITGGTFLATSLAGMNALFGPSSTQLTLTATADSRISGGQEVALIDSSGQTLISFTPANDWQVVIASAPSMTEGETYTITAGGQTVCETVLSASVTDFGQAPSSGGSGGGRGGRGGRGGAAPDGVRPEGNPQNGTFPEGNPAEGAAAGA